MPKHPQTTCGVVGIDVVREHVDGLRRAWLFDDAGVGQAIGALLAASSTVTDHVRWRGSVTVVDLVAERGEPGVRSDDT